MHRLLVPSFVWYRLLHPGREGLRDSPVQSAVQGSNKLESVEAITCY
jgi:hypothetical protein